MAAICGATRHRAPFESNATIESIVVVARRAHEEEREMGTPWQHRDVVILSGGQSSERAVSLKTGLAIEHALVCAGVRPRLVDLTPDLVSALGTRRPDVVAIALHGCPGEDGTVQGLLELLDIPYTGSGVLASALAMDKLRSKQVFRACGVPTPDWVVLSEHNPTLPESFGGACFVKPTLEGSSVGVSLVENVDQLAEAVARSRRGRGAVLAERRIEGRELTVGLFGDRCLGTIEVSPATAFYDYDAKYQSTETRYAAPKDIAVDVQEDVERVARLAYAALGCRGVARVDVMLDASSRPWVLEVNTIPGMTETSLIPKMAAEAGLPFPAFACELLDGATTDKRACGRGAP